MQVRTAHEGQVRSIMTQTTNVSAQDVGRGNIQRQVHVERLWTTHFLGVAYCAWVFLSNNNINNN